MEAAGISRRKKSFFVVPCLYLTQAGTEDFLSSDPDNRFAEFQLRYLNGDAASVENMAPCSSVMVVDRLHYMSVGGHSPEFRGHGYEDFELYHRLMAEQGTLPRADNYYSDQGSWNFATYNGFRAQLSLLGAPARSMGLFVVHLWHPRPKALSFYGSAHRNRDIWVEAFKAFDRTGEHNEALIDSTAAEEAVLVLAPPRSNVTRCLRDVSPFLGRFICMSEHDLFEDGGLLVENLRSIIRTYGITRILFPNPFLNEARVALYRWCRQTDFPYLCFDRGALPDSWFLDPAGFNADSSSYRRDRWDRALSVEERSKVKAYVRDTLQGTNPLEKQGARIGGEALARKLRTGGKKILFVPLQRPSDTVTIHMAGHIGSCENFISFVDAAAEHLKRLGWVVLCKKHPLETESPPLSHAIYVPDSTHFMDLLEMADATALINSGVGVYAMMMGKPCFIFGQAFYSIDGVNQQIPAECSPKEFANTVASPHEVDMEDAYRFLHYLKHSFYSFGTARTEVKKESEGELRSIAKAIDFYDMLLPDGTRIQYERNAAKRMSLSSPLFEKFRLDIHQKTKSKGKIRHRGSPRSGWSLCSMSRLAPARSLRKSASCARHHMPSSGIPNQLCCGAAGTCSAIPAGHESDRTCSRHRKNSPSRRVHRGKPGCPYRLGPQAFGRAGAEACRP